MPAHQARLFSRKPLPAAIVVVADEFLLLRIHVNHRPALLQVSFRSGADVPELRIPIRMIFPFFRLAVALQTVTLLMQNLRYLGMADRMPAADEDPGNGARGSSKSRAAAIPDRLASARRELPPAFRPVGDRAG